jgi:hypothetical protein
MKKQIFTIILFTIASLNVLGQSFKLDATGANDMRLRTGAVDRMYIHPSTGSIGIATTSPNAKLDLNGDLALTKKLTYTTVGTQNALDRQGTSRIYISLSGTVTLNGIAGGEDGLVIFLYTSSAATLIINNESLSALAANRIATHTGAAVTITARGGVSMIYDASVSTWRIFGFADENSTWNAKGNAGTTATSNFIGTTDSQGFVVRTNNTERMRFEAGGNVGVGTTSPDTKLHVIGDENNGITAAFKVSSTGGGTSMLFDGNEIDGSSNGGIYLNNNSTGGVYIGANGTGLKEIIKVTVSVPSFTVSANLCSNQDVSVTNAAVDSAVSASPDNGISTGLFIAYARVSAAGTVRIRVCNFTGSSITQATSDFHVAVVR